MGWLIDSVVYAKELPQLSFIGNCLLTTKGNSKIKSLALARLHKRRGGGHLPLDVSVFSVEFSIYNIIYTLIAPPQLEKSYGGGES